VEGISDESVADYSQQNGIRGGKLIRVNVPAA
jgi:hypothetical protein